MYILNYTQSYETESVVANGSVVTTRKDNGDGTYSYYVGATKLRDLGVDDPNDSYLQSLEPAEREEVLNMEKQYLTMLTENMVKVIGS